MLELKDFMPINFLKKEKFTGSHRGMRFRMEKAEDEGGEKAMLKVTVWPEPYGYDATPQDEKTEIMLEFDAEGLAKGVDWINEQFESQRPRWKAVGRN
ncbi:MAG: hypothetical protein LIP16_04920 [Clostridium sp.]|nr:hypothetical protein [Clostridium sp.]